MMRLPFAISIQLKQFRHQADSPALCIVDWRSACIYQSRKELQMKTKTNVKAGDTGKVTVQPFSILKSVDKSSPLFF